MSPARVVDHDIEPAVTLHRRRDQHLHVPHAGHIGREERGLASSLDDIGDHFFAQRCVDVVDKNAGAFSRQPLGDTFADVAAGAGDDDRFTVNTHGNAFQFLYRKPWHLSVPDGDRL